MDRNKNPTGPYPAEFRVRALRMVTCSPFCPRSEVRSVRFWSFADRLRNSRGVSPSRLVCGRRQVVQSRQAAFIARLLEPHRLRATGPGSELTALHQNRASPAGRTATADRRTWDPWPHRSQGQEGRLSHCIAMPGSEGLRALHSSGRWQGP